MIFQLFWQFYQLPTGSGYWQSYQLLATLSIIGNFISNLRAQTELIMTDENQHGRREREPSTLTPCCSNGTGHGPAGPDKLQGLFISNFPKL